MSVSHSFQWFSERERSAAEEFDKVQWQVISDRRTFFERLALLSAGAVVLSVSLLSTVFGRATIHGTVFLFAGWLSFTLALMASLFRELQHHHYLLENSLAIYQSRLADKKDFLAESASNGCRVVADPAEGGSVISAGELSTEADNVRSDSKRRKGDADRFFGAVRKLEYVAINSFWIGVFCLALFASINVLKGAGHMYFK